MDIYKTRFTSTFKQFLEDLNRYSPNKVCQDYISKFDKFDDDKLINIYDKLTSDIKDRIKGKDESLFENDMFIFPELNLTSFWDKLGDKKKKKIWAYLNLLTTFSEITLSNKNSSSNINNTNITNNTNNTEEFDPIKGIGSDDTPFDITAMISGPSALPGQEEVKLMDPGLESVIKSMGIDKQFGLSGGMDGILDELKNIDPNDLDEAIKNIQSQFGLKLEGETGEMFSDIMKNMSEEIKNIDLANGNPFESISKVATNIAAKMAPTGNEESIAEKLQQADFGKIFSDLTGHSADDPNNPMKMLNNIMNGSQNPQDLLNNLMGDSNQNPMDLINNLMSNMQNSQNNRGNK